LTPDDLRELLLRVQAGTLAPEAALSALATLPFADLGFAKVDHHRALRQGLPEVIFGQGKTAVQVAAVARQMIAAGENVLVTRLEASEATAVVRDVPELRYHAVSRTASAIVKPVASRSELRPVLVITAGTSDQPVAEEALETLRVAGVPAERLFDVGVSGLHRLLARVEMLRSAGVLIVVAGMEGALPSVVGGLVAAPVIAVPASVGYGAALSGFTALFGMLTSCASGVTVVNIDNGFGAAFAAIRMLHATSGGEP
jgi:NCAIR mutase (PurE)-related protein